MAALIEMRNLCGEASGLVPEEVHKAIITLHFVNIVTPAIPHNNMKYTDEKPRTILQYYI
ncbi:MAG: hypothetical protein VR69_04465 [Peptococcaceae bacterium BRH_c4b]|nr:MAG: hypothetical protein VR69_04465 [Peptococcaceae bacterium BRH_c4b]